jgi:flagella basal body P-ring formation protein FlgA
MILKSPWVWGGVVVGLGLGSLGLYLYANVPSCGGHVMMIEADRDEIIVAAEKIPAGTTITAEMLGVREVPRNFLPANPLHSSDVEMALGMTITETVREGALLLESDLGEPKEMGRK